MCTNKCPPGDTCNCVLTFLPRTFFFKQARVVENFILPHSRRHSSSTRSRVGEPDCDHAVAPFSACDALGVSSRQHPQGEPRIMVSYHSIAYCIISYIISRHGYKGPSSRRILLFALHFVFFFFSNLIFFFNRHFHFPA